jgi:hypothetical protein
MKINYNESARRMILATTKSQAHIMTQWGPAVDPLKSWITEWEDASVPDMDRMNQALNKMLRKLTNQGLLSSDGKPFGGIKLLRSVNDTWLLYLYSQFDTAALTEAILEGRA